MNKSNVISKALCSVLLIVITQITLFAQSSEQQTWLFLNFDYKFSDKNIGAIQLWNRSFHQKEYNHNLYFINLAYNHTHTTKTHFLGGVYNIFNVKEEVAEVAGSVTKDSYFLTPWQGVSHDLFHIGKGTIGTLTRLEEFIEFNGKTDLDIRFRERLQYRVPLTKSISLNTTTEMLFNIDDDSTGEFINPFEWRTFIGTNFHFTEKLLIELDYAFYYNRAGSAGLNYNFTTHMYMLSVDYILTPSHEDHKHHKKRHY